MGVVENAKKPAPKWYMKVKKVWSYTENTVITILLMAGYTDSSLYLLVFKLGSSYLKNVLETLLVSDDAVTE